MYCPKKLKKLKSQRLLRGRGQTQSQESLRLGFSGFFGTVHHFWLFSARNVGQLQQHALFSTKISKTIQCNAIQYSTIQYTLPGQFFLLFYAVPLPPLRFLQSILFSIWLSRSGGVARHLLAYNYISLKQGHSDSADSLRVVHIFSLPRSRPLRGNSTFQNVPSSVAPQF